MERHTDNLSSVSYLILQHLIDLTVVSLSFISFSVKIHEGFPSEMCWGEWCSFPTAVKSYVCTSGHRLAPRTLECKFISSLILQWSAVHRRNTIIQVGLQYMPTQFFCFSRFLAFCGQNKSYSVCKLARLHTGAILESIIVIQIRFWTLVWWFLLGTYGNNALSQQLTS